VKTRGEKSGAGVSPLHRSPLHKTRAPPNPIARRLIAMNFLELNSRTNRKHSENVDRRWITIRDIQPSFLVSQQFLRSARDNATRSAFHDKPAPRAGNRAGALSPDIRNPESTDSIEIRVNGKILVCSSWRASPRSARRSSKTGKRG